MSPLIPFHPLEEESQHPLAQEYLKNSGRLASANLQEDPDRRGQSGSKWGTKEVNAVRAIPLVDLRPQRIIPENFFPVDDDEVFLSLCRHLRAAKIDDLKAFSGDKFSGNPYQGFFQLLAELSTTNLSEHTINRAHRRTTSDASEESDLSTSSNEGSQEKVSTSALNDLVRYTMMNMKRYHELATSPTAEGSRPKLNFEARFKFSLGGVRHEVVNDSYIGVNYPGSISGSDRISQMPVVNMECKPRNAGGLKRGSGDPERFGPNVFAQEVAELVGSMFKQHQTTFLPCKSKDQESFVLSMHGTIFYLSTAYFSPDYIAYLEKGQHTRADSLHLWVRRSIHFDLKHAEEREESLRCIWALIRYIASGEARVNIVSSAIELGRR